MPHQTTTHIHSDPNDEITLDVTPVPGLRPGYRVVSLWIGQSRVVVFCNQEQLEAFISQGLTALLFGEKKTEEEANGAC